MVVGIGRVVLSLPGNASLKGKRAVVKRICERAKQRFGVAAAEIEDQDLHQRAVLGFACVSNDARHAQSMIDKVLFFAGSATEAVVIQESSEILRPGGLSAGAGLDDDLARWQATHGYEDDDGGF